MFDVKTYVRYMRYLLNKRRPHLCILDISGSCNASCLFCPRVYMPVDRQNGFMGKELFEQILCDLVNSNVRQVRLYSTGEPLLHPDFDYIIRRLKEEGMHITVSTNASQLMKHKEALGMVNLLQYSVEGWDQISYEYLRRPLRLKKIQAELSQFTRYLKTVGQPPKTMINLLLTKQTDIPGFLDLWGEYVDMISVHFMMGVTRYRQGRFITEQPTSLKEYLYPFTLVLKGGCMYPFDVVTIGFDGKIALCCEDFFMSLPLGMAQFGVNNMFQSSILNRVRHRYLFGVPELCQGCNRFRRPLSEDVHRVRQEITEICHPYKYKLELKI